MRRRSGWLSAATVLAVVGAVVVAIRLPGVSLGSPSAPSIPVVTAPASTAATPSVEAARGPVAPELEAPRSKPGCQDRRVPVLRVLQFNIRAGMTGTGAVDLSQIAAEINRAHADLVSLNEVDSDTRRTRLDEPAYLAGATGMHVVYGPNLVYDGGPFGNAVLTRYPVVASRNLLLPDAGALEPRGLLTVVVRVGGQRIAFSSTHLTDGNEGQQSRILEALAVARALRSTTAPTIVAGDLNSEPADVPVQILRQHLLDAQEEGGIGAGDTIPEANPGSRIDYILYDPHFVVVPGSTRVLASDSSDHRSVFTRLTLVPRHPC